MFSPEVVSGCQAQFFIIATLVIAIYKTQGVRGRKPIFLMLDAYLPSGLQAVEQVSASLSGHAMVPNVCGLLEVSEPWTPGSKNLLFRLKGTTALAVTENRG